MLSDKRLTYLASHRDRQFLPSLVLHVLLLVLEVQGYQSVLAVLVVLAHHELRVSLVYQVIHPVHEDLEAQPVLLHHEILVVQ